MATGMTKEVKENQLCTPRWPFTGKREEFFISMEDSVKIRRGNKWMVTVTDIKIGTKYVLQGAPCGLPTCFCDAIILDVINPTPERN